MKRTTTAAFTLLEIMIVVAIVGLLSTLAVPQFIKTRKISQGRRILNDLRQMDAAIDQWALEQGKSDGTTVDPVAAAAYLRTSWAVYDLLGNSYVLGGVGTSQLRVATATKSALAGVGLDWGPF